MLVAIGLFSALMLIVITSVVSLYKYHAHTLATTYQIENARRGMNLMVKDIREMIFSDDGAFPLVDKEPHKLSFYSDIDGDRSVEYVEYDLASPGSVLYKHVYENTGGIPAYDFGTPSYTEVLSEYVQNSEMGTSTFLYYNQAGELADSNTSVTEIRLITIRLIIDVNPERSPVGLTLRSSAMLRNLKENL